MSARRESDWWLSTAESDLEAARTLAGAGSFHLCAFHAQQAGEKALKALLSARGKSHRTHACTTLFGLLLEEGIVAPDELLSGGRRLDLHYIQSRYPNGLGGDPTEYYDAAITEEAVSLAESILDFVIERARGFRREVETAAARVGMATPPPHAGARVEPHLDRLLPCLRECIVLDALILFGSRAQDDAFDQSDWDFAVVSADFRGLDPLARGLLTVDCRLPMIDLVHLTPEELLQPEGSYLRCAILEDGRAILDEGAFRQAQERFEERKAAGEIVFQDEVVAFG